MEWWKVTDMHRPAEAVESLPDLLHEILLRLPAKSLLNFKTVCRKWYELITCPKFCLQHTRRNPNPRPAGMFISQWISCFVVYYVDFDDHKIHNMPPGQFPYGLSIWSSCNGLLLFSSGGLLPLSDSRLKIHVCNPATMQAVRVPMLKQRKIVHSLVLAFDPSTPGTFNIVCVVLARPNQLTQFSVYVYESETMKWRYSTNFPIKPPISGVYWNGSVYWFESREETLISFDIKQDRFRAPLFLQKIGKGQTCFFGASQGHLYVLRGYLGCNPVLLNLYEMEQDHSHLSVKYSIRNHDLVTALTPLDMARVIHISSGQDDDELLVFVLCGNQIHTYNAKFPNSAPTRMSMGSYFFDQDALHHYTESLVPVRDISLQEVR